jgi:hypothetical protein
VQLAPTTSGVVHWPLLHTSVEWQGKVVVLHAARRLPGVTQARGVAPLQTVPVAQSPSDAQPPEPLVGVAHTPHTPEPTLQNPVVHCDESPHAEPVASVPTPPRQDAGRLLSNTSSHDVDGRTPAQVWASVAV